MTLYKSVIHTREAHGTMWRIAYVQAMCIQAHKLSFGYLREPEEMHFFNAAR